MLDVAASYPNGEVCFNVSKETTSKELISINNLSVNNNRVKMQIINFSGGATNAVEFCTELMNLPTLEKWVETIDEDF